MDSTRLIINNQDLSTASVENATAVTGYTVIKAPKGPITPIRIPAGSKAKLQDIFGKVSKEYPDLLEAYTFNNEYDLYISAPYDDDKTTVPVAYVTPNGVFSGTEPIKYNETLEEIVNGTLIDEDLTANLLPSGKTIEVSKDSRYPNSIGILNFEEAHGVEASKKINDMISKIKPDFKENESIYANALNQKFVDEYPDFSRMSRKNATINEPIINRLLIDSGLPGTWYDLYTKFNSSTSNLEGGSFSIYGDLLETRTLDLEGMIDNKKKESQTVETVEVRGIPMTIANGPNNQYLRIFIVTENQSIRHNKVESYTESVTGEDGESSVTTKYRLVLSKNIPLAGRIYLDGDTLSKSTEIGYLAYNTGSTQDFTTKYVRICTSNDKIQDVENDHPDVNMTEDYLESASITFNENYAIIVINGMGFDIEDDNNEYKNYNPTSDQIEVGTFIKNVTSIAARKALRVLYISNLKKEDIFAVIFAKYPSNRNIKITFKPFDINSGYDPNNTYGRNLLRMNIHEEDAFRNNIEVEGSLDSKAKNGYNFHMGFTNSQSYKEQDSIAIQVIKPFAEADINNNKLDGNSYPPVELFGGGRTFPEDINSLYDKGWEKAKGEEYSDVDVFFEARRYPTDNISNISGVFTEVANIQELSGFVFNKTVDPLNIPGLQPLHCGSDGSKYWNICNEAIVELEKTGERFISPLTGSKAVMQARIIENRYGGEAPMYLNKGTPGMGGQLPHPIGASIINLRYKYNKNQQRVLDSLNYNPVIKDSAYGVMVVGQKTCKLGSLTDWSYIGHVSSFLNFQKEVRKNVMIPQLGKPNSEYYRSLRKQQVENILNKRLQGNNRIWAQGIVDTSTNEGVNDLVNMRAKKFVIDVKIKVDIFSEFVELNFTNLDQGMDLV